MSRDTIRLGIVGLGVMGSNHFRVAREMSEFSVSAVLDSDQNRAHEFAARVDGCQAVNSIAEMIEHVDAVVVASPTRFHGLHSIELLKRGVHVLVEKPIAPTYGEARAMMDAAASSEAVLAVGHIERFNAAVIALHKYVTRPLHIETVRVNPFVHRVPEGVILDLMIHDIEILLSLLDPLDEPEVVVGVSRVLQGQTEDLASISVRFASGITAHLSASRVGQRKIRSITVTQQDNQVRADLVRQDLTVHRMAKHELLAADGPIYQHSSVVETPFLQRQLEPLAAELLDFATSIATRSAPKVGGVGAGRALLLAERAMAASRA